MDRINKKNKTKITAELGILQWFHIGEYDVVEKAIEDLKKLKVKHIRTGISWADWYTETGHDWYRWLIPKLAKEFEILPCFLYTPPSIGIKPKTSSPPKDLQAYADVMDVIITEFGEYFEYIELWNEPNNKSEWDFTLDNGWEKFAQMIIKAAHWARHRGKKTVLGGMSPIDASWLELMFNRGVMEHIDVVGIHGFPEVFDLQWEGWEENIARVQQLLNRYQSGAKIWITEAGYSTWQYNEMKQIEKFTSLLKLPLERIYWYTLHDLDLEKDTVDGFHLDEREYFFGLKNAFGTPKLLYRLWQNDGLHKMFQNYHLLNNFSLPQQEKYILITGGAGFVGTNIAKKYLNQGQKVMIYDNLTREGVEKNYAWLKNKYGNQVQLKVADIRDPYSLKKVAKNAKAVFHLAAQVAVTTSLEGPVEDFDINLKGTMNLLEALRALPVPPPLIFTSTNKVYGNLADVSLSETNLQYVPQNLQIAQHGINEDRPLSFHSPYGCSKGAADQYVLDYARVYNIPTVVFRMSCIYGPHQMGTEDQGWVAHFALNVLKGKPITVFGDGKQVRDILFVDDLVRAFQLAHQQIAQTAGHMFNIGGGSKNAVSLKQVIHILNQTHWDQALIHYDQWRTGDQKYYVSDTRKFQQMTGWKPIVGYKPGIVRLYHWLKESSNLINQKELITEKTA
ncbi:MAG: SDR family NAD(P)-dependent oxidoreductase [Candidatus Cyclobacteriaceae bacterium M3_2C_046]